MNKTKYEPEESPGYCARCNKITPHVLHIQTATEHKTRCTICDELEDWTTGFVTIEKGDKNKAIGDAN